LSDLNFRSTCRINSRKEQAMTDPNEAKRTSQVPDVLKDKSSRSSSKRKNRKAGSQETSVLPTLYVRADIAEREVGSLSMEFHMTIRSRVSNLTQKQASMLLSIANARAVHSGVDMTLWLAISYLYNALLKSGHRPEEIWQDKVRRTLLLSELILASISGDWFDLRSYEAIDDETKAVIISTGWLPNDRTLQSWKQHWDLEKYLAIRIVPVERFQERNPNSLAERYSGYTKGYGNDGNVPAPGKTKPSAELDGEEVTDLDIWEQYAVPITELENYQAITNQVLKKTRWKRRF
jgi:hypothetical protein